MLDPVGPTLATQALDSVFKIVGDLDATKSLNFQVDTQATASQLTLDVGAQTASRTLFAPVLTANATLAALSETQTFTGAKTFSAAVAVTDTTASTNTSTGCAKFSGGVGIVGDLWSGTFNIQRPDTTSQAVFIRAGLYALRIGDGTLAAFWDIGRDNASTGQFAIRQGASNIALTISESTRQVAIPTAITASSSITGSMIFGDGATVATNVGIGGGKLYTGGAANLGTIGSTFAGNVLAGVQNATAAVAGQVGEISESKISTATNAAATATYLALTSITLQPGDWDIAASAIAIPNGATVTVNGAVEALVGTTTASSTGSTLGYDRMVDGQPIATGVNLSLCIPAKRVNISVATTYFLNVLATYTAGTPQWQGSITARRAR